LLSTEFCLRDSMFCFFDQLHARYPKFITQGLCQKLGLIVSLGDVLSPSMTRDVGQTASRLACCSQRVIGLHTQYDSIDERIYDIFLMIVFEFENKFFKITPIIKTDMDACDSKIFLISGECAKITGKTV